MIHNVATRRDKKTVSPFSKSFVFPPHNGGSRSSSSSVFFRGTHANSECVCWLFLLPWCVQAPHSHSPSAGYLSRFASNGLSQTPLLSSVRRDGASASHRQTVREEEGARRRLVVTSRSRNDQKKREREKQNRKLFSVCPVRQLVVIFFSLAFLCSLPKLFSQNSECHIY